jgi:hypothetical protein
VNNNVNREPQFTTIAQAVYSAGKKIAKKISQTQFTKPEVYT